MLRVLFILVLIFNLFVSYGTEAKSKVKLSKKYLPQGNPGGTNFYEDEDFVESYRLYEKRRKLFKKKRLQGRVNINIDKENLVKKLKEKKITTFNNKSSEIKAYMVEDGDDDAMINQHGINITRLKGAVFIDQDQYEGEQLESKQQKEKKATVTQEEKSSSINSAIKDTMSKKTCSYKINNLNNLERNSLNRSDLFKNVIDTPK